MLSRGWAISVLVAIAVFVPDAAMSDPEVQCDPNGVCVVVASDSGSPGSAGPAGSSGDGSVVRTCRGPTGAVPCYDDLFGGFNEADGCDSK
jgi:hypothetical protein